MKKINRQFNKLVAILNDGAYHDGDALGVALNVTRAAIWKMIEKLREYGVVIQSVKGKGYQLKSPLFLLDDEKITAAFVGQPIKITCVESVTSTNDYFKSHRAIDKTTLDVCLAEHQTEGRGRHGRMWVSPYGQNIYMSCRYHFDKDLSELGGLSLVVGLAVSDSLKAMGFDSGLSIKWPNDVMWNGKKLAGILVEVRAEAHGLSEVVIGIGMNVNLSHEVAQQINQGVTSLSEIQGTHCDRTVLAIQLVKQLVADLALFQQNGWDAFKLRWEAVDFLQGRAITLLQAEKKVAGVACGVSHQGYLLLQQEDGCVKTFASGEATVSKEW